MIHGQPSGQGYRRHLYEDLKQLAAAESRSVSVVILCEYLAKRPAIARAQTPAEVLLGLAGSWDDDRGAEKIASGLRAAHRSSKKLAGGFGDDVSLFPPLTTGYPDGRIS